jgi:hypothetical protein
MAGKLTPLQRAYLLGYRRALARMRKELDVMLKEMKQGWDDEIRDLKGPINGMERDYNHAIAVAKAMAERDPEVRLH